MDDDMRQCIARLAAGVSKIGALDLGHPVGENVVKPGSAIARSDLPPPLLTLYTLTDGISLPDVHIGYFIHSAEWTSSAALRGEPEVVQHGDGVFGSNGGGGRFALGIQDGAVYYLPTSGAVRGNVFFEEDVAVAARIASGILDFVLRLEQDVGAFVRDDRTYSYLPGT